MRPWTMRCRPLAAGLTALALAAGTVFAAPARTGKQAGHKPTNSPKAPANLKPGQNLLLAGQVSGAAGPQASQRKAPSEFHMKGSGAVAPLGQVTAAVALRNPQSPAKAQPDGTMTLTGPRGSVDLALTSPGKFAFTGKPIRATFQITRGTGSYSKAAGSGSAEITLNPEYRPPRIPGRPTPMFIRAAMFTIALHGKAAG